MQVEDIRKKATFLAGQTVRSFKQLVARLPEGQPAPVSNISAPADASAPIVETEPPVAQDFIRWERNANFYARREFLAQIYLKGEGIEIGALNSPLKVPESVKVKYVDRTPTDALHVHYAELGEVPFVEPDIIDDGEKLATIQDATQDFVIANHFLEHCQDTIDAFGNMLRVIKPGGIIFLTIPDKRSSPDINRPVTTIEHLIRDHEEGPAWSKKGHFEEWVRLWTFEEERVKGEEAIALRVQELMDMDYSIHYHVWTPFELMEFFVVVRKQYQLNFDVEIMFKNEGEVIFILRKN